MAYPTPPVLDPIAGTATPNLTTGGPYDEVLKKIETYFAQLGSYVDAQIAAVRGEIPSTTDFATAEQLEAVKQSASDAASAAAAAQATATAAQGAASTAQGAADEASASVSGISTKVENMLTVNCDIPVRINGSGDGLIYTTVNVFNPIDGMPGDALQAICCVLGNFALATPNGDQSKLFGYLGSNTQSIAAPPSVQSSAALTAAYEAGITQSEDDPVFTASQLANMRISIEGVPYLPEVS